MSAADDQAVEVYASSAVHDALTSVGDLVEWVAAISNVSADRVSVSVSGRRGADALTRIVVEVR